jgi:predicted dehydrogenase
MGKKITRREFLGKSAVLTGSATIAASGLLAAKTSGSQKTITANDRIRFGLIGAGMRGIPDAQCALSVAGTEFAMVADLYDGRLARCKELFGSQLITTKDYDEILARPDIDAVIIVTPDHWHKKMTIDALRAGKDVYLQKPATWSWKEGIEIMAVQKKTDRLIQVGSQHVSSPQNKLIQQKIKNGEIGQVTLIECNNHRNSYIGAWYYPIPLDASQKTCDWDRFLGPAPKRPWSPERFFRWRNYWDYSGGLPTDLFVHRVTLIHHLMGVKMVNRVYSSGKLHRFHEDGREVPDQVNAICDYDDFTLLLTCTGNNEHPMPQATIYGTAGTLVIHGGGFTQYYEPAREDFSYTISTWPEAQQEEYRRLHSLTKEGRPYSELLPSAEPVTYNMEMEDVTITHLRNFFECVRTRKKPVEDMEAGHLAVTVAHMVNISGKTGKPVTWDEASQSILS